MTKRRSRLLRFDGIQDDEISPDSDWQYLTPLERIGVQTYEDAQIARRYIEERKNEQTKNTPAEAPNEG